MARPGTRISDEGYRTHISGNPFGFIKAGHGGRVASNGWEAQAGGRKAHPLPLIAAHMNGSRFLACIADPSRFELLQHLAAGPRCVNDLAAATGQSQSNVSHHLKRLRDCGFAAYDRDGKQNVYRLAHGAVGQLLAQIEKTRAAIAPLCVAEVC